MFEGFEKKVQSLMNTSISSLKYAFVQNYNIAIVGESGREKNK